MNSIEDAARNVLSQAVVLMIAYGWQGSECKWREGLLA